MYLVAYHCHLAQTMLLRRLQQIISRNMEIDVLSILRRNFYVDDMLKSFPSAKIALDMIDKVKSLCKEDGFNLTKFSSNHIEVLKSIPDECRKDKVKEKGLNLGILPEDKVLGVK